MIDKPYWRCCGKSRGKEKFCSECGKKKPEGGEGIDVLYEFETEIQRYNSMHNTLLISVKNNECLASKVKLGHWTKEETISFFEERVRNNSSELSYDDIKSNVLDYLYMKARIANKEALSAERNKFKYERWHRVLSNALTSSKGL